jgi:hypothetical protein
MAFGLALHTCNLGTATRNVVNPFTREPIEIAIDPGLTIAERDAVRSFLSDCKAGEPDPDTFCKINLNDGCIVNVAIGTLDQEHPCIGFAVECSALTSDGAFFVLELAKRGNMSIGSSIDGDVVAFTSAPTEMAAKRWPLAQVMDSADQLKAWLAENIERGTIV